VAFVTHALPSPETGLSCAPMTQALPVDLDARLPPEIAGRTQGWLTRYRQYPVFSPAWARGRAATLGVIVVLVSALLLSLALVADAAERPYGALVQVAVGVVVPLFAGPWLGSRVRRQGWPPRHEWIGLVGVVAVTVAAMLAFNQWLAEPVKQAIAERTGMVDEQGRRKRVALMIGVTIRAAQEGASAAAPVSARAASDAAAPGAAPTDTGESPSTTPTLTTQLSAAFLAFCLAGGFALPRWRREREGLAALAQTRELEHARAARREAELRLSVLAAQVEPHFLFNTLAGVRSAIATDPARASALIDRLAEYLRAAIPRLRSDGGADATLGSQLEIVQAYLALMVARMPRLSFAIDVPAELRAAPFPPLMLISLAENAVKHGAEPKVGPVRIELSARRTGDARLEVTVADDGAGFGGSSAGGGLGLANIRERLREMFGARAALELKARADGGVAASIVLPME
jgi:signal transduction histidine kinase